MRAARLLSPGRLELQSIPDPAAPEGGALLEIKACAVCGTDIKIIHQGHRDLVYPRILGHEIVGRIRELDGCSTGPAEGDLVQIWPGIACGKCRSCGRGRDNLCRDIRIMGFNSQGGFAELLALPAESLSCGCNPLPANADCSLLALSEPLACCLNGQSHCSISQDDFVLILGGGPIGAMHALLARFRGAEKVMVAEKLPERIRLLRENTDAVVFDPADEPLQDLLAAETEGQGADVIISASPQMPIDQESLHLLSPGGRACVFSGPAPGHQQKQLDLRRIHYHEITVFGSYGCTSLQNSLAVELLLSHKIRADWLITRRASLSQIDQALDHSFRRAGMKSVVCF
ncbi:MAG: alcohol dehydrogenase catalytic domain-containing protein [Methanothrix sp.]|nr:alcohol dehydrogenase catalytic domain-containing protein [Methanothrix sp.]